MNSDYSVPIIQGTPVPASQPYVKNSYEPTAVGYTEETTAFGNDFSPQQQQQQPNQFQDVVWAVAFVLHLVGMIGVISANIANADGGNAAAGSFAGVYTLIGIAVVSSVGISTGSIALMMRYPTEMVKAGLFFSVFLTGAMAILLILYGQVFGALFGVFFFVLTLVYARMVWPRIPFAAANLKTALSAVKANMGLGVVAYLLMIAAFAWSGFWMAGMLVPLQSSDGVVAFLLLVSYYWTFKVLCNTVIVTTAGTVGTWWFVPGEARGCWSSALRDSFCRATTYSFGSICMGSLLVAVIQALETLANRARQNEDGQLLACLLDCILSCIRDLVEYFNKWAYVYVGLYGFGYIEAGRNVIQLFQQKGWTVIITDNLNDRVLLMMSFGVGALTGIVGTVAAMANQNLLADLGLDGGVGGVAFLICFFVGLVFSSILMSVVGSAVDTVIVCYAESPNEFEANHPSLSGEMRSAWMQAWPELSIP